MHLVAHGSRNADAARLGQRFQPRRNVNAVAGDVRAIDDDVAEVDADAELEALVSRLRLVRHRHGPLHVDRAPQRRVCAAEFEEHPIARGLDDMTAVLGNLGIDQVRADLAQAGERARIVAFHVTAEPDDVGNENRGEPAGDASIDGHPCSDRRFLKFNRTTMTGGLAVDAAVRGSTSLS